MQGLKTAFSRWALQRRVARSFKGHDDLSIVASNCIGARLTQLAGLRYNSPTVDLWMPPDDFLNFVCNLAAYKGLDFREDTGESTRCGYPVGHLSTEGVPTIQVYFQHYRTLLEAQTAWTRRFDRLNSGNLLLTFTDRDGVTEDHLRRFDALPYPKLVFTARRHPRIRSSRYVKGYDKQGQVGDLYTDWDKLAPALTSKVLSELLPARK